MIRTLNAVAPRLEPAPLSVAVVGLGAIGLEVVRLVQSKRSLRLVAVADPDPAKAGKELGELLENGSTGLKVLADPLAVKQAGATLVFHCTRSFVPEVAESLRDLLRAGLNVVSSTEELSYPALRHPALTQDLDALARHHGVRVLGTGVNPGFVMDTLPLAVSGLLQDLNSVRVERVVDARHRRYNLQKKIGAGMTVAEFDAAMADGKMGHIGLLESAALLAEGLGWKIERYEDEVRPVIADQPVASEYFDVPTGGVTGIRQKAVGYRDGAPAITLELTMALGALDPRDRVELDGKPKLAFEAAGGVMGDQATASVLVNSAWRVMATEPGVRTMLDLPLVRLTP